MVHKTTLRGSGLLAVVALVFGTLGLAGPAAAYPEPAMVSPSWALEFEYRTPQAISVEGVDGTPRWYWYMRYKVTNHSGDDRLFIPEITVATDTGKIIDTGANVPASVFHRIRERERDPLLESPVDVVGRLLQGDDYARESVAIWPAPREPVNQFRIFVAGLSGETASTEHPVTGETVMLRRTLMLTYHLPGRPSTPQRQPVVFEDERDVMR
ncbi:hypothetical protein ACERK3_06780 [Phycisphaerales bacterium AB-hyl4]|uniref:Outer membrane lipoprotein-sorting protein n=1 Tax=Natronomicrosphaera hydrolytica TaxID=3242702 RepID=A0ABV4U5H9_9BACT